ncbi:hypothetical protein [Streptomyces sp. SID1121]|uniref:hypothetical protein n=1 Tax=Streptomyces sp. SID1121 TaxID=3425888 RepID=UPI0040560D6B
MTRAAVADGGTRREGSPTGPAWEAADLPKDPENRFVRDIVHLHSTMDFRDLPQHLSGAPLYHRHDERDDLIILTVTDDQLPLRYLNGIMGFRLVQYLRLGWISPQLVYRRAVFRETVTHPPGVQNIHTISLCTRTGRIRGYISLACTADRLPLPLDHPRRYRFSTETAHRIDLLGQFAAPGLGTHQVFEIKRFVRDLHMPQGRIAERVPWHLLLGLGRTMVDLGDQVRVVFGDAKEHVALRHFRLTGFDLQVPRGTTPNLPESDLMAPIYRQDVVAVPFVAPVPPDLGDYMDLIRGHLDGRPDLLSLKDMVTSMNARKVASRRQARQHAEQLGKGGTSDHRE